MSEPTEEELVLINKFRENVKDILKDDYMHKNEYLIRWLRARNLNLEKSEKMVRDSIEWRKKNNVDRLIHITLSDYLTQNYPYNIETVDRDGRIVFLIPVGRWDLRKSVDTGKTSEFTEYVNQMFERLVDKIKQSKSSNPNWAHTQMLAVADWDGFSFTQLGNMKAVQGILNMAITYEAHYPEMLFNCVMINCTNAFSVIFKLMKPLLAARTKDKIVTYGSNKKDWSELSTFISENELPEQYGGSNNKIEFKL